MRRLSFSILVLWLAASCAADEGIDLAEGLTIRQVADDDLVPDCTTIAVDSSGNVVASGRGYIRMLVDENDDGVFESYRTIVEAPGHGAHGICFEGTNLYYVGDGAVWKMVDTDGDGVADSDPTRVLEIKTGGEHDAHALRKGPDGYWYLIAGNGTRGMFDLQNADDPAIPFPRAGAIWRISPDWSEREVWAHGFRNAYDFDFAPGHAIDTFDSDGERDVSLPWYRPTRVFRVRRGDDAGWITRSWKRPNLDPQMPQVLAELGRGSPTGVLRYRHQRLPARFHRGVFVLDWTFGRIVFVSDKGRSEVIASPSGTNGFAVTDIDSLPDGRLVVSVGGRRTRGGVYLIDARQPQTVTAATGSDAAMSDRLWSNVLTPKKSDETQRWITKLRDRTEPEIDHEAAAHAISILRTPDRDAGSLIAASTLLIESVGGLGAGDPKDARGKQQVAAVFDGYRSRLRPKLNGELIAEATDALIRIIQSRPESTVVEEAIRALAVIEPESKKAFDAVAADLARVDDPVAKLHRLIALARLPVPRSDEMTAQVARVMLEIPVAVEESNLNVDRNWTPRLTELFLALERRDSLLPSRLVATPEFGHPSHLVWTERMDPENLERARVKCLAQNARRSINPRVAKFIARGNDMVPRSSIEKWLANPETRTAAWLAIARHPGDSDVEHLQQAAVSLDDQVRKAARSALERIGAEIPQRTSGSKAIQEWISRSDRFGNITGDPVNGKGLFALRQCNNCHNGATALGPPLEGISKRFSTTDLFRATIDPNHTISDRYRATQVLTSDGEVVVGMMIYQSVDGITLLTADNTTRRINADAIDLLKPSDNSLMPEGLLDGLSDAQVGDLLAYMRSL